METKQAKTIKRIYCSQLPMEFCQYELFLSKQTQMSLQSSQANSLGTQVSSDAVLLLEISKPLFLTHTLHSVFFILSEVSKNFY